MAGLRVLIVANNAAFAEDADAETARILEELAARVRAGGMPAAGEIVRLRDFNGNDCGNARRLG